jgi:hypothetical protein
MRRMPRQQRFVQGMNMTCTGSYDRLFRARLRLFAACLFFGVSTPSLAATQCINQNAPAPLEICVQDSGRPAVWVQQPNGRTRQYYGDYSWGSVVWLNGNDTSQRYGTGYYTSGVVSVSNTLSGTGAANDPYVITTVVDLGATSSVRMTQRFSYVNGDRIMRKSWSLANNHATATYSDVRFFHGGDTYFGGSDSARSWYDAANTMVYVNNNDFTNSGYMGFFANPATPAAAYFGGHYGTGNTAAHVTAQLPSTADSNYVDAGYYLQWNRASLAPGQTWNIEAYETWSAPGPLQVLPPANAYVSAGDSVQKTFKVHNLSGSALNAALTAAATPDAWTTTLPDGASLALNAMEVKNVAVNVDVSAVAAPGNTQDITLTATSGADVGTGTTRLSVLQVGFTITPNPVSFGTVLVGNTAETTIILSNGAGLAPVDIGQLAGTDALAAPFSIFNDTCSNTTVAIGGTCTVGVRYQPGSTGSNNDTFSWPILSPIVSSQTIAVSGNATLVTIHTVSTSAAEGGTIAPTSMNVTDGDTASFSINVDSGYRIDSVSGCGGTLTGSVYTTGVVYGACNVTASFSRVGDAVATSGRGGGGGTGWLSILGLALLALCRQRVGARILTLAALALSPLAAVASDWYAGVQLGRASTDVDSAQVTQDMASRGISGSATVTDATRNAWKLYGGYTYNQHLSIEGGYTDLGEIVTHFQGVGAVTLDDLRDVIPTSGDGAEIALVGRYALGARFAALARVGLWRWRASYELTDINGNVTTQDLTGTDGLFGLGMEMQVNNNWSARLAWDRYRVRNERADVGSLGVIRRF